MNCRAPLGSAGRTVRVQIRRALQCTTYGPAARTTLESEDTSDISASSVYVQQDTLRFGSAVGKLDHREAALTAIVEEFAATTDEVDSAIACVTGFKNSVDFLVSTLLDIERAFSPALHCTSRFLCLACCWPICATFASTFQSPLAGCSPRFFPRSEEDPSTKLSWSITASSAVRHKR